MPRPLKAFTDKLQEPTYRLQGIQGEIADRVAIRCLITRLLLFIRL
ncbi:hypothetical protein [Chelatococcus asaccharovorans]|nr:hypothetical protein [Chelatococcus asaccharovorans]